MESILKAMADGRLIVFPSRQKLLAELKAYKREPSDKTITTEADAEFWQWLRNSNKPLNFQPKPRLP